MSAVSATGKTAAARQRFGDLLAGEDIIIAPGAYDALSAKVAAQAGADAVYLSGFGVSGSLLGVPDIGLVSATEMADRVRALAAACAPAPLLADGDNGHGGPLNAARLTALYEAAGAACIQIEDQVFPKRCGHMANKQVIGLKEAAAKIRACVEAREDRGFKIMARTDARAVNGLDDAIRRGEAFLKAGADILFIEAPQSEEELALVGEEFGGEILVANMVEDGRTPYLSAADLQELGFAIAAYPVSALLSVTQTLRAVYGTLKGGTGLPDSAPRLTFPEYNTLIGLDDMLADAAALDRAPDPDDEWAEEEG